jgi:hypothetical membrane protein
VCGVAPGFLWASIARMMGARSPGRAYGLIALGGILLYGAIDVLLAFIDPRYSLLHNAESDYGVGPNAWLMDVNFVLRGVLSVAAVVALWRASAPAARSRPGVVLLLVWAAASGLLAFFPDDPLGQPATQSGRIHIWLAALAFLGIFVGAIMVTLRLGADRGWQKIRPVMLGLAVLAVLPAVLLGRAIGRPQADFGLFERLFLGLELAWMAVVAAWAAGPHREVGRPPT